MKWAIISDVHGNLAALQAVLTDIDQQSIPEVISLGDQVGYGPQPAECLALLTERGIPCLLGNHEMGLVWPEFRAWFNPQALEALMITRKLVGDSELAIMRGMPSYLDRHDCRLVHGAPPDSPSIYLFELSDARIPAVLDQADHRLCFVGHTHDLELVSEQDGRVWHEPLGQGEISLAPDRRYLVNIGSVGQPRDGDNRAKYAIIDVEQGSLEIRFVAYDIAATVKMIKERGLPAIYGQRLW